MTAQCKIDRHYTVQNPGEGQQVTRGGLLITVKAPSAGSSDPFILFEIALPPHLSGAAPHVHCQSSAWFYILNGTLAFTLDAETVMLRAGSSILIEPAVVYTFWNPAAAAATLLGLFTRGDFDAYLATL